MLKLLLQDRHHVFLDYHARVVQILNDKVVACAVNVDNDGLDGRVALDENAWAVLVSA